MIGILTRRTRDDAQPISYVCDKPRFVIGRAPGNDLMLDDRSVSRVHAIIVRGEKNTYALEDQDSRNGTTINGIPVLQKRLRDRDVVSFGDLFFDFNLVDVRPDSASGGNRLTPVDSDIIRQRQDQTLVKIPTGTRMDATPSAEGWQIVRLFMGIHSEQLETTLEQVVHDLSGVVGIRHTLLFLPFSDEGGSRFIRRGDRASRYFSEERMNLVMKDGIAVGIKTNKVVPLAAGISTGLDAVYIPFSSGHFGSGCLYADAEDELNPSRVEMFQFAAEAISIAIKLHKIERVISDDTQESALAKGVEIVGRSSPLQQLIRQATKAAATDYPVLIRGETGTGKELLSRLIHDRSKRNNAPHMAVNCGAATEALLMSDLFGHEKGAFTGAVGTRKGHFENLNGGTIFLDEIGEAPLAMQAALLRVLQEQKVTRVGSSKEIPVDVRIIAATNRDLEKCVEEGTFRRDLLHRLNTVELVMPALRERRDDIPALIQHFIQRECRANRRPLLELAPTAMERMMAFEWPGNIRELENAIKWAVTMAEDKAIHTEDLPRSISQTATPSITAEKTGTSGEESESLADAERRHILSIVSSSRSKSDAARRLGIGRNTLYSKLQEYGMDPEA